MDNWISTYTHNGVSYTHNSYTGETIRSDVYRAIRSAKSAASAAWWKAHEAEKKAEHELRMVTDPVYRAKIERAEKAEEARKARVAAAKVTREELTAKAEELAETMFKAGVVVTDASLEEWRITNGYFWKVVSPKGTVFTETLKTVTIDNPDDYVVFNAMKMVIVKIWQAEVEKGVQ